MNAIVRLIAVSWSLTLTACGLTTNGNAPKTAANSNATIASLPAQEMTKGSCMVFLWENTDKRPLVFTQDIQRGESRLLLDGKERLLERTSAADEIVLGFFAEQQFLATDRDVALRIKADSGGNLADGIRIPHGLIRYEEGEDEKLVSVSGLMGCKLN